MWADRRSADTIYLVHPLHNFMWTKNGNAIKASTLLTHHHLGTMVGTMPMRFDYWIDLGSHNYWS
jgi:hypothetical protein